MPGGPILVVRHGPGRGRGRKVLRSSFRWLAEREPALAARLAFHETGAPELPKLGGVRAVVFLLADPLRERYPACFAEAQAIAQEARSHGARLLNPPHALSNSIKSTQARLWRAAGIPTPPVRRAETPEAVRAAAEELGLPALVRSDELHSQQRAAVVRDGADLDALAPDAPFPAAVSPLLDTRAGFPLNDPRRRLHHKQRLLVLGDRIRTKHLFFSDDPVVSNKTYTFGRAAERPAWRRRGRELADCIRRDVAYWRQQRDHPQLMRAALDVLGLDLAAIDYSATPDGGVVLWEANPYPYIPGASEIWLQRRRRARKREESYHRAVADFLGDLLEERA